MEPKFSLANWPQDILRLVFARLDFYYLKYRIEACGDSKLRERLHQERLVTDLFALDFGFPNFELLPFLPGLKSLIIGEKFSEIANYDPSWLLSLPATLETIEFRFPGAQQIWLYKPEQPQKYFGSLQEAYTPIRLDEICPVLKHLTLQGSINFFDDDEGKQVVWSQLSTWIFIKHLPKTLIKLVLRDIPHGLARESGSSYLPPHLEYFEVPYPPDFDDFPQSLYESLRHLPWCFPEEMKPEEFMQRLSRFKQLESIRFPFINPEWLKLLPTPTLRHIYLSNLPMDEGFIPKPNGTVTWSVLADSERPASDPQYWEKWTSLIHLKEDHAEELHPQTTTYPPNLRSLRIPSRCIVQSPGSEADFQWIPRSLTSLQVLISAAGHPIRNLPPTLTNLSIKTDRAPFTHQELTLLPHSLTRLSIESIANYIGNEEREFAKFCRSLPPFLCCFKLKQTMSDVELVELHKARPSITWVSIWNLSVTGRGLPDNMRILSETTVMDFMRSMFARFSLIGRDRIGEGLIIFQLEHFPPALEHLNVTRAHQLLSLATTLQPPLLQSISVQERSGSPFTAKKLKYLPTLTKVRLALQHHKEWLPDSPAPSITDLGIEELDSHKGPVQWAKTFPSLTRLSISFSSMQTKLPPKDFFSTLPKSLTWLRFNMDPAQSPLEISKPLPSLLHVDLSMNLNFWKLEKLFPNAVHLDGLQLELVDSENVSALFARLPNLQPPPTVLSNLQFAQALLPNLQSVGTDLAIKCAAMNLVLPAVPVENLGFVPRGVSSLVLHNTSKKPWNTFSANLPPALTKLACPSDMTEDLDPTTLNSDLLELFCPSLSLASPLQLPKSLTTLKVDRISGYTQLDLRGLPTSLTHLVLRLVTLSSDDFTVLAHQCPKLARLEFHDVADTAVLCNIPPSVKVLNVRVLRKLQVTPLISIPLTLCELYLCSSLFGGYWGTDDRSMKYFLDQS